MSTSGRSNSRYFRARSLREWIRRRAAFTLAEALVAITLVSLAGSALLLSVDTSTSAVDDSLVESMARNLADQLLEEALGKPFMEPGSTSLPSSCRRETGETTNPLKTALCDDTDDYHLYFTLNAMHDPWAISLGQGNGRGGTRHTAFQLPSSMFSNWASLCTVEYVEDDLQTAVPSGNTSNYRLIKVYVWRREPSIGWKLLASVKRVSAYVPPPS